jgi:alkylation response protein AidB-like acyl-CoA dehydrogenase
LKAAFTDEQAMVGELADDIGVKFGLRAPSEVPQAGAADPAWAALAQSGLTDIVASSEEPRWSCVEAAVVVQALARHLCPTPYLGQAVLAPSLLRAAGIPHTADLAATRRTVGLDAQLMFRPSGDGIAFDSADADLAVRVSASGEVALHALGERLPCADITRSLRGIGERSGPVLGVLTDDARRRWVALALTAVSADLLGVAEAALAAAVDYAKQREQYGRPIGANQAIQHLLAEQAVSIEGAKAAVFHAAWAVDCAHLDEAESAARVAKAFLSRIAQRTAEATIQVFGGLGMTWEATPHVFLRRALLDGVLLGDERTQLHDIASTRI